MITADLEALKQDLALFQSRVELRQRGRRWVGLCPLHEERTPSFCVEFVDGVWLFYCHGCGAGGSIIDLVMLLEGCTTAQAIASLTSGAGSVSRKNAGNGHGAPSGPPEPPVPDLAEALPFSEDELNECSEALARGWEDANSLAFAFLQKSGLARVAPALRFGFREAQYFGCFEGCDKCGHYPALVIPLFWDGKLTAVKFRNLKPPDSEHKWFQVPGSKSDYLWLADALPVDPDSDVVGVFEGIRDTALARALGFNAVGMNSASTVPTGNPSARFLDSIERLKKTYNNAAMIGHRDEAGEEAKRRLHSYLGRGAVFCHLNKPYKDLIEFYQGAGEEQVRRWLTGIYGGVAECRSFPRGTPKEKLEIALEQAVHLLQSDAEPRTVAAGLSADLWRLALRSPATPKLSEDALHGIAGDIIKKLTPHTEAHPAGILVEMLMRFGNIIGRTAYYLVESTQHYGNLFAVKVGATSRARKGTASGRVDAIFKGVDPAWTGNRIITGLSSGEGLIHAVRDEAIDDEGTTAEPGIMDRRLFVREGEFASTLAVLKRPGNTLSPVIRSAFDGALLQVAAKNAGEKASNAHISIMADITAAELHITLSMADQLNGFANRFLWVHTERSAILPHGGEEIDWTPEVERLKAAVEFAKRQRRVYMTPTARQVWGRVYEAMAVEQPGIFGAVTARGEAYVIRLALLYALLDQSDHIGSEHLRAALALWQYCEDSARFIFQAVNANQQKILDYLSEPRMKTHIIEGCFSGNRRAAEINEDLDYLIEIGKIKRRRGENGVEWFSRNS
jgi:hypothetical protein